MAALSISPSVSPSRRTVTSPSSTKSAVSFGDDDVNSSLSTTFYEGDESSSKSFRQQPQDRKGSAEGNHVGFGVGHQSPTTSFDNDDVDLNYNANYSSSSGDGSGARRFLTAKYKKKKMGMVRRRIEVEDWIDIELKRIFDVPEGSYDTYDAELDLDEILDIASDNERIVYIKTQLSNATKPAAEIDVFVDELMSKIAAL